jgi:hypothetical protein
MTQQASKMALNASFAVTAEQFLGHLPELAAGLQFVSSNISTTVGVEPKRGGKT